MNKPGLKWNLFIVFSYIQFVYWAILLTTFFYRFFAGDIPTSNASSFLFLILIIAITLNSFFNIYIYHRYFPGTPVPASFKPITKITGIVAVGAWLILFLVSIMMLQEIMNDNLRYRSASVRIFFTSLLIVTTLEIYTFIMQLGIFRFLVRNNQLQISSMIDSIGKEGPSADL